jgi:hypothetical protein
MPTKKKNIKSKKISKPKNKEPILEVIKVKKKRSGTYFGKPEEEAVVRFLNCSYNKKHNLIANKSIKIKHDLGTNVTVRVYHIVPNENAYSNDAKFLTINIDIDKTNFTKSSVNIQAKQNIKNAVIIITDEVTQNKIYSESLKYPFERMVELIIKKYKLYRENMTIKEQIDDTISFLITKAAKFEPGRNKKAYSYYGTISKHYNLGLVEKERKMKNINSSYEDRSEELEGREDLSYRIDNDNNFSVDLFIKKISTNIKTELEIDNDLKRKLTDNERKVGKALIEILDNWESALQNLDGSNKFNKVSILETMRNITNLSTKDIRLAMKRYKEIYGVLKQNDIDNED